MNVISLYIGIIIFGQFWLLCIISKTVLYFNKGTNYSDVSIKNVGILPNRQYIAYTADSAQEQYS